MTTRKKNIEHKTFCNISEDVAETFFDIDFENGSEILETSDSDSDEIDVSMDTDVEESKKAVVSKSESIIVLSCMYIFSTVAIGIQCVRFSC